MVAHDAQAKSLGTGRSVEEIARSAGLRVKIVPRLSAADGINAVRTLFPVMWFDKERCADGVQALRHYRYDVNADTGKFSRNPLRDEASNASDALRYVAVAMRGPRRVTYKPPEPGPRRIYWQDRSTGWMGS